MTKQKKDFSIDPGQLRLRDFELLRDLLRSDSLRDLARARAVSPGNLSKQIRTIEICLGIPLVERSSQGIKPTPEAMRILPFLDRMQHLRDRMLSEFTTADTLNRLTIASTSSLSTSLLPPVLTAYKSLRSKTQFRLLEMPPASFIPIAMRGGFQICIHIGEMEWPRTWTSANLGSVQWNLYARKNHPLGGTSSVSEIRKFPFVMPAYWFEQGVRYGNDYCPLPPSKRLIGAETATAAAAIEIVQRTDQLGFFLDLTARSAVKAGLVAPIHVPSWNVVKKDLYLSVKNDSVSQRAYSLLQEFFVEQLEIN